MSIAPLILGHRGASALAPENTLAAFSRAISDGADGVEFDVRLSRDGIPVVIHDATLKRTAPIDGSVSEMTAADLNAVDVGTWFSGRSKESFRGENLPTLTQVFELFSTNDGLLYVELKCDKKEGAELAAAVVTLTRECRMFDRVVVESFDHAAIAAVKKRDAGIRTAALFEPKLTRPISTIRRLRMVDTAVAFGADEIALHHTLVGPRLVERAIEAGLEIVVWTVDDATWIARARTLRIKALISNNPGSMVRNRDRSNADYYL
jgi:glycerophosphoryl diester phosphodiesterase